MCFSMCTLLVSFSLNQLQAICSAEKGGGCLTTIEIMHEISHLGFLNFCKKSNATTNGAASFFSSSLFLRKKKSMVL